MYKNTQKDRHAFLLCFTDNASSFLFLFFFFNKLNLYDNSVLNNYIGTIFPRVFANFMSLSPFGNSHNISSHFIIIIFVFLIYDQCFLMLLPNKGLDDG